MTAITERLTTEQRVIAAERTAREAPTRSFGRLFVTFDRSEDYFEWKRLAATGSPASLAVTPDDA